MRTPEAFYLIWNVCQFDEKENITIVLSAVVDDSFCLLLFAEG